MNMHVIALIIAATTALTDGSASAAPRDNICREVSSGAAQERRRVIKAVTGGDTLMRRIADLPAIADTSEVYFVQDSSLCRAAAKELARRQGYDTLTPPSIHLLRVGATRYLAFNYHRVGDRFSYSVFDDEFRHVVDILN